MEQIYVCQGCKATFAKWDSKCPKCGQWKSITKALNHAQRRGISQSENAGRITPLNKVEAKQIARLTTQNKEFDKALGGGIVAGSIVLIAGDPGIGKSTLMLQTLGNITLAKRRTLYITGEESQEQIKLRADRIGYHDNPMPLITETSLENIFKAAEKVKPEIMLIDSIQTIYSEEIGGTPGGVSQINECALRLMVYAKNTKTAIFLIGHITKDGQIAGTKTLEHLVDAALYFEGDKKGQYRILRASKNRFGATDEIGVFEMKAAGLMAVENPSAVFMSDREKTVAGSVISCYMGGSRALLYELQCLVGKSSFSNPQRLCNGFDSKKLTIILALLERFAGFNLEKADIFSSIAAGLIVDDNGLDLALALSVVSAARQCPMPPHTLVMGELGLSGDIRAIGSMDLRLRECHRLGIKKVAVPKGKISWEFKDMEIVEFEDIAEAAEHFFGKTEAREL